jgi:glycosyltransferase involved in cell wall biosynthesis
LIFSRRRAPIIFRGDSHRLVPARSLLAGLRRQFISGIYRRMAAFLPVGQANRDYFSGFGVPPAKLFFCPHAVDNERFMGMAEEAFAAGRDWKLSLGIAPDRRTIVFAGKFEEKKRPRDLIAAFKRAALKNTTLLLVGNGHQEDLLRQDAAGRSDIVFAPFQNQTQMPRTYAAGDLFVLPSFGPGETWGLAINEAMCLGRPVIVSDHVGCAQDLVKSRQNGLVFPAGDVPALTAALTEAFAEPGRLQQWGDRSRELVQLYDYALATAGLRAALDFVLQRK